MWNQCIIIITPIYHIFMFAQFFYKLFHLIHMIKLITRDLKKVTKELQNLHAQ